MCIFAGGSWQPAKTVMDNLKLAPGLLSQFDLVFVMMDSPDAQHDARLSEELLAQHAGMAQSACMAEWCWQSSDLQVSCMPGLWVLPNERTSAYNPCKLAPHQQ